MEPGEARSEIDRRGLKMEEIKEAVEVRTERLKERKERRELFNFHTYSQMCFKRDLIFEELVAK